MGPDTLLALSLTNRFFRDLLQSKSYHLLWVESMDQVGIPHFRVLALDAAMFRHTPAFRIVNLIYHTNGPCDRCGQPSGRPRSVCFLTMRRLCAGCQHNS